MFYLILTFHSLVLLCLIRVQGTSRVAFVLMHDQMMITAGAVLGTILA